MAKQHDATETKDKFIILPSHFCFISLFLILNHFHKFSLNMFHITQQIKTINNKQSS